MTKTLVIIAHPDIDDSSSQQYLIESGKYWTQVDYLDLTELYASGEVDIEAERQRLLAYDRLFFQFPLYWYQAPAILKRWLDEILPPDFQEESVMTALAGKELGLIVTIGTKEDHFQVGAREERTLSEMFTPYEMLARALKWRYLPVFNIHQFEYMVEEEKMSLMMRYACYLETGNKVNQQLYHRYILEKLEALDPKHLPLPPGGRLMFDLFKVIFEEQLDEFEELMTMTEK